MSQDIKASTAQQIAAATRMLVMEGLMDYSGHISARLPGTGNFLIQSASDSRAELDPDRILVVDMDGEVVEGDLRPPLEVALHCAILRSRPDVNSVLHCHTEQAITFTLMKDVPILPLRAHAVRWASGVPVHADPGHVASIEEGEALAQTLAHHNGALIRSHGLVLVAESVPGVFIDAVHFRENASQQLAVMQAGREPIGLSADDIAQVDSPRDFHIAKLWNYFIRQGKARGVVPEDWSAAV